MHELFTATILGIVEGITEMLPVSSTAHLLITNHWWSFTEDFTKVFDVVIQSGAILAVLVYFWKELWPFGRVDEDRTKTMKEISLIIVAIIPVLVLGAAFGSKILDNLFNIFTLVGTALVFNGILLILVERRYARTAPETKRTEVTLRDAIVIGITHAFAIVPGMSRSASASIGGMFLGLERNVVARFSMKMGIPTLLAATAFALLKLRHLPLWQTSGNFLALVVGFVVSGLVCYATVRWFFAFIKRNGFAPFGWYRIALGVTLLAIVL